MFANGPGDLGSILGRVVPKTLKMVLGTSLLNTQENMVCIKGKVEQSRERSGALPYTSVVVFIEKGAYRSPSTTVADFTYLNKNGGKEEKMNMTLLISFLFPYIYIYIYIYIYTPLSSLAK